MIQIIDYGRGNLNNVYKAFKHFGYNAEIIEHPDHIEEATGLVLPGVGAFADSMKCLDETGFSTAIKDFVKTGKPLLGICLGLHLLFEESEEFGIQKGLSILKGRVKRFDIQEKVPHMGWNQIQIQKESDLYKGIKEGSFFYFVHSYYVLPEDPSITLTTTNYEIDFTSSIHKDNIYATQFHPEKSQTIGLEIINNFGEICAHHSSN